MNQKMQIKRCIKIWENRLLRLEADASRQRAEVNECRKRYDDSVSEVARQEEHTKAELQQLNEQLKCQVLSIDDLNRSLRSERSALDKLDKKRGQVSLNQSALTAAEVELEAKKKCVSDALKKTEKYKTVYASME